MKKTLFSVGAASMALAMLATGCASTQQASLVEEVKKAEAVVANARGLENHTKQADKYLLPNALLDQTKVLYISWAAVATDSIGVRFGEADVISVSRDAMDASNLKAWDAMRNADADKAQADSAAAELKKFIAESYAKNKTTSKLSNDEMFDTVVGKIAQEDYIAYKAQIKAGEASEADYKDQKAWLAKGKANVVKVAAEQKKRLEAAEKRLAKAEKEAEETKRKIDLTIQYYSNQAALLVANIGVNIAKEQYQKANGLTKPAMKKALEIAEAQAAEFQASMDEAKKEFPQVTTVVEMPPLKFSTKEEAEATKVAIEKELGPWKYAGEIGGKRFSSYLEVKKWAKEAQKTLNEAAGE